jgi:hypothetical protein
MTGFVILMGGITLVVGLVALADLWTRRHDKKSRRDSGLVIRD